MAVPLVYFLQSFIGLPHRLQRTLVSKESRELSNMMNFLPLTMDCAEKEYSGSDSMVSSKASNDF